MISANPTRPATRPTRALLLLALAAGLALRGQSVPTTLNYQGRLTDNSPQQNPLNGPVTIRFDIFDAASGGVSQWNETDAVTVTGGIFSVLLGSSTAVPASLFSGGATRYLQLTINPAGSAEILSPRQKLAVTGYAGQAANATTADQATNAGYAVAAGSAANSAALGSVSAANWQAATNQSCTAGSFLSAISSSTGAATCTASSGLTLPYYATDPGTPATSLVVEKSGGSGGAGRFTVNNAGNFSAALQGTTNGNGLGLDASCTGTGCVAASFNTSNASNNLFASVYLNNAGIGNGLVAQSVGPGAAAVMGRSGAANSLGLIARGFSAQAANLQEWQNSSGTALSWVDALGGFHGNGAALTGVTASGLALPYSGTDSGAATYAFSVTESAIAGAGYFRVTHPTSGVPALTALGVTGTALYGQSNGGDGVEGISVSFNGVSGMSTSGRGVVGQNFNSGDYGFLGSPTAGVVGNATGAGHSSVIGYGVSGSTGVTGTVLAGTTGNAGSFQNNNAANALPALTVSTASPAAALSLQAASGTGTALEVVSGAIKVTGAGIGTNTAVFIHVATAANTAGNVTVINHPLTNNDPGAILIVTQNYQPNSVYNKSPIGVYYNGLGWAIFNQGPAAAAMPVNAAFNVLVIKP